ncbi:MAG: HAMP domain-containing sensor histidine kinase [Cyanobacteria bacterium P01_A01_bin.40]
MTLLRYLLDWLNVVNSNSGQGFSYLRKRLLIAYFLVMATVLGISATALYVFFSRSLNQQLDNRLQTLVQAAAPSLDTIKSEGRQSLDRDLPWRELFSRRKQSLEWFGVNGRLLSREGEAFPRSPLVQERVSSSINEGFPAFQQENQIRSATIAVYTDGTQKDTLQLKGYIRASESTYEIEATLNQLQLGLWLGGGTAIFFIGMSSIYLTHQAFKPTLESYEQLKRFAADASHELGGPLTKISFASEMLLSDPEQFNQPTAQKKVKIIKSGAEQMKRLLEDLLFLARTDVISPLVQPREAIIFLEELLQQLVVHFQAVAQKQKIKFETDLAEGLKVAGDGSQLSRLFSNLINNAFKYTERGGKITLSLRAINQQAVVSIADTGIGISAKYLPYVFQRFWRADQVNQQEGLGLGLAIAQTIAQQHGGKITVTSELEVGTCFKVYLPLA